MEIGGVQSGIMNFVRTVPRSEAQFDLVVLSDREGFHEEEFRRYGEITHIPVVRGRRKWTNPFCILLNNLLLRRRLNRFFREHPGYGAVHTKLLEYTAVALEAAKLAGVPVRIAQSHVDRPDRMNPFHTWYYARCAKRIAKAATVKLAVTKRAASLLFGEEPARVIKNPTVDLSRLDPAAYSAVPHPELRLVQVGTFSRRKNQLFSIDVLKALADAGTDARLVFVGFPLDEPDYIGKMEARIRELGLEGRVAFEPKDTDMPALLSGCDMMLIPSLREGLPNVALEAQAMGVPCFLSDTVTREADCGLCTFLSLEDGPEAWAEAVTAYREAYGRRKVPADMYAWDHREIAKEYVRLWRGGEA